MASKTRFQTSWLSKQQYAPWLEKDEDVFSARCKLCKKSFSIMRLGESGLRIHAKGIKHQANEKSISSTFDLKKVLTRQQSDSGKVLLPQNPNPQPSCSVVSTTSASMQDHVAKEDTLKAEIIWTLYTIDKHCSFSSNSGIAKVFQYMFPDSAVAKKFSLSDRKTSYLASFGLAPYFTSLLEDLIKCEEFVLLFDESMNDVLQTKQMDFHVRFWDQGTVRTRYLTSNFLGHCTASDMVSAFDSVTANLNLNNLIQLSMDGPNVNWAFYKKIDSALATEHGITLLNAGSCSLHKVHGACKTAMDAVNWKLDKILRSLFQLFHDTPARREDFVNVTGTSTFPLQFCKHRWLENTTVAQRALNLMEPLRKYVGEVMKSSVSDPKTESFKIVKEALLKDEFLAPKLAFFISLSKHVEPYLTEYQTDAPMLQFAHHDLNAIAIGLLKRFVIPEKIEEIKTTKDMVIFQVTDPVNHVTRHKVAVGFVAESMINELKKAKKVSELQILEFKDACKSILVCFADKFLTKSPLHYGLVKDMACLNPAAILESKAQAEAKLKRIMHTLVSKRKFNISCCDAVLNEFSAFVDSAISNGSLGAFSRKTERIDTFLYDRLAHQQQYSNLWQVVKTLLLLSHGQATVERGFSINKEVEEINIAERTLIAKRIIIDAVRAAGGIDKVEITPRLLISASSAYSRYEVFLQDEKKKKETEKTNRKRKALDEEIMSLKKKKSALTYDIETMNSLADDYALKAEHQRNLTFISTSNSLRTSVKKKLEEQLDLDKLIDDKLEALKYV